MGMSESYTVNPNEPNRIGNWPLSNDREYIKQWIDDLIKSVEEKYSKEFKTTIKLDENFVVQKSWLDPLIQEFMDFIDEDATLFMQYTQMFTEVSHRLTPSGYPQVKNYHVMLVLVDYIMKYLAPTFQVKFPLNEILNWPMGTISGHAAFLNEEANKYWMKILNKWGSFLTTPESRYMLVNEPWGWFGKSAQAAMPNFEKEYICDPAEPYYGFTSWDDFFTRKFREGVRPVAFPEDKNVITSACESTPYDLQVNVQWSNKFWVKQQWYSLRHMLKDDQYSTQFVGGTVYQAFLNGCDYHRWHSPVDGTIIKATKIPGTYFSGTLSVGEDKHIPNKSQAYICQVATRAVILIEADNPAIGLMCFMAIGMTDVSSCEINPGIITNDNDKRQVKKGQEIGTFHYGGSGYCLVFRPGVPLEFDPKVLHGIKVNNNGHKSYGDNEEEQLTIKLNSRLASVEQKLI